MTPRATYRFQFHKDFTFADAEALVPYLDRLGISHVYASPITVAAPGSTHGYDVVDPTCINPELGGEDAFRRLVAALRARGMGVVIDIVPNHMGVAGGANAWWNDVLMHGQASDHAAVFDIDFRQRIVLPVLGTPLPQAIRDGALSVERYDDRWWLVAYGEHRFPLRDADQDAPDELPLPVLLDRQHYRLAWWRVANDELNWRRFFSINELAGVRVEDPAVFEATHALYFRLYAEGLIDGVRIDHVDGLTDPAAYCRTLRTRLDALPRLDDAPAGPAWIVVEKILGPGEKLPTDWGIDGTSGYDFMEQVSAVLHDPAGAEPLGRLWHDVSGRSANLHPEELLARQQLLAWQFTGQLEHCCAAFVTLAHATPDADGITAAMLRRAIERLLWVFPVYRTYGTGSDAPQSDDAIRAEARRRVAPHVPPGEWAVTDMILAWLAAEGPGDPALVAEAARRFQQLSAPIAAKALEDTAFYRYGRLLSRNDVGFDAGLMGMAVGDFHALMAERAAHWPNAMLTTATHDHKRGEDTRARLAVLSAIPDRWRSVVTEWEAIADGMVADIDRGDRYMLFQALLGAWPDTPEADFADRVASWQTKALREAKLRSSWEAPDEDYEGRANTLARALIEDEAFAGAVTRFVAEIAPAAERNSLIQVALRCTVPGVPDLYQGTEFADLSLVDPDNRRPVNYAARRAALDGAAPAKMALLAALLQLRREQPDLFAHGDYRAAAVTGDATGRVLAFERRHGDRVFRLACLLRGDAAQGAIRFEGGERDAGRLLSTAPVWYELS
ncbi:maltooligosyl trehalose synthase [Sphingomonas gellani]|uniref:Maltooligosyl trehalose synthase n=1 Tax=Sphingomonas gellani TaxID=1166340 RepID=A0A1H8C5A3_9SPHN|nr:malto-oligosyltrehalose synthase [Sphingomonas gellani]SEM90049.1 maltooligosyl trehalose synthase [Sphingomonas gellani]